MKLDPKYDDYDFPTTSPNVQSGHPGHTTPEQDAQVFQLRMKLEQLGYTERLDTLTLVRESPSIFGTMADVDFTAAISSSAEVRCGRFRKDVSGRLCGGNSRTDYPGRFIDSEKWRKDFNLDYLVRNFDYPERAQIFEYYPQYYHKTDKVFGGSILGRSAFLM